MLSFPIPPLLAALAGILLDHLLGEPRRAHPLVGFARLATVLERSLNTGSLRRGRGLLAWMLAVLPLVVLALLLRGLAWSWQPLAALTLDALLLWFALGGRSLAEHGLRVAADLAAGDLAAARTHVGWIVSRDTTALDAEGVSRAAVESVLENGNDAVFGAFFWFLLLGGPGALLFRLANTLDAMWGYRNERFLDFGAAAARIDDALNWLPARLTALSYALCGATRQALTCWRTQAPVWDSPNAGPVMAAGAGALGVRLGGAAVYHGRLELRPPLGAQAPAGGADIVRAVALVRRALLLWLLVLTVVVVLAGVWRHA